MLIGKSINFPILLVCENNFSSWKISGTVQLKEQHLLIAIYLLCTALYVVKNIHSWWIACHKADQVSASLTPLTVISHFLPDLPLTSRINIIQGRKEKRLASHFHCESVGKLGKYPSLLYLRHSSPLPKEGIYRGHLDMRAFLYRYLLLHALELN